MLLRWERSRRGRSQRWLALAVGANLRTIRRVESGDRRPSGMLLRSVASALDPDDPRPLGERLCAAAGRSLATDTDGKLHHWTRRANVAILAGHRPLPSRVARAVALHQAADRAYRQWLAILDEPGALDDPERLAAAEQLHEEARRLRGEAGLAFTLVIGGRRFTYGLGLP